jgi:hypothetical protein
VREPLVAQLYEQFLPARPVFWRLNDDLFATVLTRRRRIPELRRFQPPVRVIFGARDRDLNPRVARQFAALFPTVNCTCSTGPGTSSRSTSRSRSPPSSWMNEQVLVHQQ